MVLEQLQQYKKLVYDKNMLEIEIEELKAHFQMLSEPSYISPINYDRIPSGGISDQTGRLAAAVIDGDMEKGLQQRIRDREYKLSQLQREIKKIDVWLCSLSDRERWVITQHIIEGLPWRIVRYKFINEYGEEASTDTLKRLQHKALA